jgi:hypothetical protein
MKAPILSLLAGLSIAPTQAADAVLTLACQGTATDTTRTDAKPEPISMGIILNFTARTVKGFTSPTDDFPVTINHFNEVTVEFGGHNKTGSWTILGSIDRVTGDLDATSHLRRPTTHDVVSVVNYSLKCRPTQRMF